MSAAIDTATVVALEAALELLAPPGVRTGASPIEDRHVATLVGAEQDAARPFSPLRRREFASGRALLRRLLGSPLPIPIGSSRAPDLPHGIVGSVAHDRDVVIAATAHRREASALGVDVEPMGRLEPDEAAIVVRDDEPDLDPVQALVLKEAAYKAWSGLGGRMLDFGDVRITLDTAGGAPGDLATHPSPFVAELDSSTRLAGRWCVVAGRWVALVSAPGAS